MENTVYISLGSNLGDKQGNIRKSLEKIGESPHCKLEKTSRIIENSPLSSSNQPDYCNCAAKISTSLAPAKLLEKLQKIEDSLGREREYKWSSRTIDLDIIYFNGEVIDAPELQVPHPQMHLRSFVLCPLAQIAPSVKHPVLKYSTLEMLEIVRGRSFFNENHNPRLVCIAGTIGAGKTTLAKMLSAKLETELLLEDYQNNPFLPFVYQGREDLALNSELYFLDRSLQQLRRTSLRPDKIYITDFLPEKSLIFPKFWLNQEERLIFYEQFERAAINFWPACLILHIKCPPEIYLQRIEQRQRKIESRLPEDLVYRLSEEYCRLIRNWKKSPVLEINSGYADFRDQNTISDIAEKVRYYLK
ncbi:2-amino-4-hydroxy-6-hydroxymethyldihydropteridine pyrophosphokinase [Sedimentisphaera cyanobacteriorum]|uniref:2-amino-4-hydroxy-6-hydroxymethyldihydropteridine pyrophosphokinase n=1 Tax=Sedimentisphaera cyanobacteriorum TaxID=1940790 RepID=A0A1Q2HPC4_9BACT|nr:2-amino-4-hydroxy-6-hydroxymethyldihydropteridine diphosphokinase [Sedimentisphaera cyanobacteriorum]AQQ09230.1 2-amino-4-hydroxy-6-hydroxymethyldihydropteridine pyrophosphokinase [Sedimentisphaera cyanobacteriorum]